MMTPIDAIKRIIETLEARLRELTRPELAPEPVPVRVRID
jgi:hypothetical protein